MSDRDLKRKVLGRLHPDKLQRFASQPDFRQTYALATAVTTAINALLEERAQPPFASASHGASSGGGAQRSSSQPQGSAPQQPQPKQSMPRQGSAPQQPQPKQSMPRQGAAPPPLTFDNLDDLGCADLASKFCQYVAACTEPATCPSFFRLSCCSDDLRRWATDLAKELRDPQVLWYESLGCAVLLSEGSGPGGVSTLATLIAPQTAARQSGLPSGTLRYFVAKQLSTCEEAMAPIVQRFHLPNVPAAAVEFGIDRHLRGFMRNRCMNPSAVAHALGVLAGMSASDPTPSAFVCDPWRVTCAVVAFVGSERRMKLPFARALGDFWMHGLEWIVATSASPLHEKQQILQCMCSHFVQWGVEDEEARRKGASTAGTLQHQWTLNGDVCLAKVTELQAILLKVANDHDKANQQGRHTVLDAEAEVWLEAAVEKLKRDGPLTVLAPPLDLCQYTQSDGAGARLQYSPPMPRVSIQILMDSAATKGVIEWQPLSGGLFRLLHLESIVRSITSEALNPGAARLPSTSVCRMLSKEYADLHTKVGQLSPWMPQGLLAYRRMIIATCFAVIENRRMWDTVPALRGFTFIQRSAVEFLYKCSVEIDPDVHAFTAKLFSALSSWCAPLSSEDVPKTDGLTHILDVGATLAATFPDERRRVYEDPLAKATRWANETLSQVQTQYQRYLFVKQEFARNTHCTECLRQRAMKRAELDEEQRQARESGQRFHRSAEFDPAAVLCTQHVNFSRELQRLECETAPTRHFPFESPATAMLYHLPEVVAVALDEALAMLIDCAPRQETLKENQVGQHIFSYAWVDDFAARKESYSTTMKVFQPSCLHAYDELLKPTKICNNPVRSQVFKIARKPSGEVRVNSVPVAAFKHDVNLLQQSAASSDVKWLAENNWNFELSPKRGNRSTAECRGNLQLGSEANTTCVVGGVRSYYATEFHLALTAVLGHHVTGQMIEEGPYADAIRAAVLLALLQHRHTSYGESVTAVVAMWESGALSTFISGVTSANAAILPVMCAAIALLADDPRISDRKKAIMRKAAAEIVKRAADLCSSHFETTAHCIETPEALRSRWRELTRLTAIALSCFDGLSSSLSSGSATFDFTLAYMKLTVMSHRARALCGTPHPTATRLEHWVTVASFKTLQWLQATRAQLCQLMTTAQCPVADDAEWSQVEGAFHVYHTAAVSQGAADRREVNLETGEVYINGRPVVGVPSSIRATPLYKALFGAADFEVTQRPDGSYASVASFTKLLYPSASSSSGAEVRILLSSSWAALEECDRGVITTARIVTESATVIGGLKHWAWHVSQVTSDSISHFVLYRLRPPPQTAWIAWDHHEPGAVQYLAVHDRDRLWRLRLLTRMEQMLSMRRLFTVPITSTTRLLADVAPSCHFSHFEPLPQLLSVAVTTQFGVAAPPVRVAQTRLASSATQLVVAATGKVGLQLDSATPAVALTFLRFGISFRHECHESKPVLVWVDDEDYAIAADPVVPWLPMVQQYLRLQRRGLADFVKPETLVLIPIGEPQLDGTIRLEEPINETLGTVETARCVKVYRHEHFHYVDALDAADRLYLAAVMSVGDTGVFNDTDFDVPTSRVSEVLVLMRQTASNCPWSAVDWIAAGVLVRHWHPSVRLLGAFLEQLAHSVSFLHGSAEAPKVFTNADVLGRAMNEYNQLLSDKLLDEHCVISPSEWAIILDRGIGDVSAALRFSSLNSVEELDPSQAAPLHPDVLDSVKAARKHRAATDTTLQNIFRSATVECPLQSTPHPGAPTELTDMLYAEYNAIWGVTKETRLNRTDGAVARVEQRCARRLERCRDGRAVIDAAFKSMLDLSVRSAMVSLSLANPPDWLKKLLVMQRVPKSGSLKRCHLGRIVAAITSRVAHESLSLVVQAQADTVVHAQADTVVQAQASVSVPVRLLCLWYVELCSDVDWYSRVHALLLKLRRCRRQMETQLEHELWSELMSPREAILEKPSWLVFEAEQRLTIRQVQYSVWQTLASAEQRSQHPVTQLNMGQGKTRVIIPMLILDECSSETSSGVSSCVHALSSVVGQYQHYYREVLATPGLRVTMMALPFHRNVSGTFVEEKRIKQSTACVPRSFLLVAREHALSLMLKREEFIIEREDFPSFSELLPSTSTLHIFDEVDALLRCDQDLVYSVGAQQLLSHLEIRGQIVTFVLMAAASVMEQLHSDCVKTARRRLETNDEFPPLTWNVNTPGGALLRRILEKFLDSPPSVAIWMRNVDRPLLHEAVLNGGTVDQLKALDAQRLAQVMLLRGLFHHGVLLHCLSLTPQEKYGVPSSAREKKTLLAVPYEAADVPSKRSEFAHPDVAVTLTFLAYFHTSLTEQHFYTAVGELVRLPPAKRDAEFSAWGCLLAKHNIRIASAADINCRDAAMVGAMFAALRSKMTVISFWIRHCVLSQYCKHFPWALSASAWDVAHLPRAVGFSGTSDTHVLLPDVCAFAFTKCESVHATTAVMIKHFLSPQTRCVALSSGSATSRRRATAGTARVLPDAMEAAIGNKCSVVIDVGGMLAGASLSQLAVDMCEVLRERPTFPGCRGVAYFDHKESPPCWCVMDLVTHESVPLTQSSIMARDTFVIYDQARCRGHDLKLRPDARALTTLSMATTKDDLLQGIGRLRRFGCNQTAVLALDPVVCRAITQRTARGGALQPQDVLSWCISNTLSHICRSLPMYIACASHQHSKATDASLPASLLVPQRCELVELYEAAKHAVRIVDHAVRCKAPPAALAHISSIAPTYEFLSTSEGVGSFSGVTEREIVQEVQQEHQHQQEVVKLDAATEPENTRLLSYVESCLNSGHSATPFPDEILLGFALDRRGLAPDVRWQRLTSLRMTRHFANAIASSTKAVQLQDPLPKAFVSEALVLRRVEGIVVDIGRRALLLVSSREGGEIAKTVCGRDCIVTLPPQWGGFYLILLPAPTALPTSLFFVDDTPLGDQWDWLVDALVFCMLFNGHSMFLKHQRDVVQRLFVETATVEASATLFLKARHMCDWWYPHSALQAIVQAMTPLPQALRRAS